MSQTDARLARAALDRHLEEHPFALPPAFGDRIEQFVGLLLEANGRLNLTRVVEPDAVARLHVLDSLAALRLIDELAPSRALDIGSGGGVPGIVLAIARPEVRWLLVDSVARKVDALRSFVESIGLGNVAVIAERAEVLGRHPDHRERYDLVTARACAALPVLVEYALPLVRDGGSLLAWKGARLDEELGAGAAVSRLLGGGVPAVHATHIAALGDHRLVTVTKEAPTPEAYPRRPGVPSRRPLR